MKDFLLSIDQGTTGTTALILDSELNVRAKATTEFPQHFPQSNWVEHDLEEIWASVGTSVEACLEKAKVSPQRIAAIGITNQRETTCLWRRENARPVAKAIVWQDRRTASVCERLKKSGLEREIHKKTGLLLDPYFSATKLQWMLKNIEGAKKGAESGELCFGTIDSYLLYRMTGSHKTDVSNASRTLLMDIKKLSWDPDLLKLFQVPKACLPQIENSAVEYGRTRSFFNLPDGIPVTGMVGDQQAALFGQACFKPGLAKCTYGTGAFILVNTGRSPVFSKHRLLTTVAWKIGKVTTYGLEGSAFIAGAAVQWLRDGLKTIPSSRDVEALAREVEDSDGVMFVPALSGLGAPHWLPSAKGLLTGITRRTTKAHVARAVLEGVAYQVSDLVTAMGNDRGKRFSEIRVDGGAAANNLLMQFQSDILGVDLVRSEVLETTALGAALQAGLGVGFWSGFEEIQKKWKESARFSPGWKTAQRKAAVEKWGRAIKAVSLLSE